MGREDVARDHYLILAEDTDEPGLKEMLLLFAREEEQHKEVLLTQLQDMQGALQWFDPSELAGLMED